jgi:hypothetical protein
VLSFGEFIYLCEEWEYHHAPLVGLRFQPSGDMQCVACDTCWSAKALWRRDGARVYLPTGWWECPRGCMAWVRERDAYRAGKLDAAIPWNPPSALVSAAHSAHNRESPSTAMAEHPLTRARGTDYTAEDVEVAVVELMCAGRPHTQSHVDAYLRMRNDPKDGHKQNIDRVLRSKRRQQPTEACQWTWKAIVSRADELSRSPTPGNAD